MCEWFVCVVFGVYVGVVNVWYVIYVGGMCVCMCEWFGCVLCVCLVCGVCEWYVVCMCDGCIFL